METNFLISYAIMFSVIKKNEEKLKGYKNLNVRTRRMKMEKKSNYLKERIKEAGRAKEIKKNNNKNRRNSNKTKLGRGKKMGSCERRRM